MNKRGKIITVFFLTLLVIFLISFISANNWPKFHNDPNNTGYQNESVDMAGFKKLWSFSTGNFIWSSPSVSNGVVYFGDTVGHFYALDAIYGTEIWNKTVGSDVEFSSPSISGGVVYICSGNAAYALNATTGVQIWNYIAGSGSSMKDNSIVVSGGVAYFAGGDFHFYALNATTGVQIWNYTLSTSYSVPVIYNGLVYASDAGHVYALNATTGIQVWNQTLAGQSASSPALYEGVIYIGDNNFVQIFALNATTGAKIWNYTTGGYSYDGSPAVYNGVVYATSSDNNIYALNATTGVQIWNYSTGGQLDNSPAISSNGIVFFGSEDDNIYALNITNGNKIWNYTTGLPIYSSPTISNGIVYIGSNDGNLYAFSSSPFIYQCDSFSSCTYAISSAGSGDVIKLNSSISFNSINPGASPPGSSCASPSGCSSNLCVSSICQPYPTSINFNGKDNITFDCQNYSNYIEGDFTALAAFYINETNGGSNSITIKNCNISNFYRGIILNSSNDNLIQGTTVTSGINSGIYFFNSTNNTLTNLTVFSNYYGVYLSSSPKNNFLDINSSFNGEQGFYSMSSNNNTFSNIISDFNFEGFHLESGNNLTNVTASSNWYYGISMIGSNIISNSVVSNSTTSGLYVASSNNKFYNNLFNNTVNYYNSTSGQTNYFNTSLHAGTNIIGGNYIGGNFWDNYSVPGTGPSYTCLDKNHDGICESSSYSPDGTNYDYLPLDYPKLTRSTVQCDSVSSCNNAIGNASYGDTVELNTSLTGISTTAINLTNINNITLDCLGNLIVGTLTASTYGLYLSGSNYTTIKNCSMGGFYIGIGISSGSNNTIVDDTANSNGYRGILLSSSQGNIITNSVANSNNYGIAIYSSSNNTLTNTTARMNAYGIYFYLSSGNTMTNTNASKNSQYGIYLDSSSNNTFTNSTANLNNYGIEVYSSSGSSNNNTFTNSTLNSNFYGITFVSSSNNNTFSDSTVSNSSMYGLQIASSSNLFYNNIFNNSVNYYNTSSGLTNYFNTTKTARTNIVGGQYIGGNYWTHPNTTGFSDICSGANGTCSSKYNLSDGINFDYLPLTYNSFISLQNVIGNTTANKTSIVNISNSSVNSSMDLQQIDIVTKQNVSSASVTVARVNETSPTATIVIGGKNLTSGKAYQAFKITPSGGLNDSVIKNVTIYFKVNKTWVSDNGLDANNITLYRELGNGTWTPLTTTLNNSDSNYYYLYAVSPGFSIYIIFVSSPYVPPSTNPTSPSGGAGGGGAGGGIASNSTNETCTDGQKICTDGNVQICVLGTYTDFETCEFGCDNGVCLAQASTSTNSSTETSNTLTGISNFFNSITPAFFRQTSLGYVIYYVLLILIISGIAIVSYSLYKRTVGTKSRNILKEVNRKRK